MAFYDNYVRLCAERGMSPSAVALDIGIKKSNVTYWKNGRNNPSDVTIVKIANYFGVPVEELLDDGIKKGPIPKDGAVSQEKQLLLDMIDGLSDEQKELLALSKKMSDDELKRFIAAMKAMLGESM